MKSATNALLCALVLPMLCFAQNTSELTESDALARLIKRVQPQYPPLARQARIQGDVLIHFTISEEGMPTNIRLISGHPMLSPAALEAVKQWRFRPYEIDDQPVESQTEVTISFSLTSKESRLEKRRLDWIKTYEQRTGEHVFTSADEVQPASPEQIPSLKLHGAESDGSVEVWCIVDAAGQAADFLTDSASREVSDALRREILRWKFTPARDRGLPVAYLWRGYVPSAKQH